MGIEQRVVTEVHKKPMRSETNYTLTASEFFSLSHLIGWEGGEMFLSQWQGIEAETQLQWTLQQEIILQYF